MRWTDAGLMPRARAIVRTVQWVAAGGWVCRVASTTSWTVPADSRGTPPPRGRSRKSADGPPAVKRRRHRSTVGRVTPRVAAITWLATPAIAWSTILLRSTTRCGVVGKRAQASTCWRWAGVTARAHAGFDMIAC